MRTSLSLALLLATTSAAAAPTALSHQGRLFDPAGLPLDGTISVEFGIYDAAATGTQLWTETQDVDFDNGYFAVTLGSTTPVTDALFDGGATYLELTVAGGTPLPFRVPMLSVPYALNAETATNLDGGVVNATDIQINGTTVIDSSGVDWSSLSNVPSDIADGDADTLAGLGCSTDDIAIYDGSSWGCGAAAVAAHAHDAGDITTGTLDILRLPIGIGSSNVAAGDHGHTAADVGALPSGGGTVTGALEAQSGVLLGAPTTCSGAEEGTVRYTSGTGIEYCDGSAWIAQAADVTGHLEALHGTAGKTELYHFAMQIPGANVTNTGSLGGNGMLFCSVLTDDNEPNPVGMPHPGAGFENGYVLGFASDVNGHCLSGHSAWDSSGPCVSLLVSNWEDNSHEGYGAWCLNGSGNPIWAQINIDDLSYWTSSGRDQAITKPANPGDVTCTSTGQACVARVR